jgi:hypothetical protein
MLVRTTDLIGDYLKANYAAAVGGPTGKTAEKEDAKKSKRKEQAESKESADQQSTQQ